MLNAVQHTSKTGTRAVPRATPALPPVLFLMGPTATGKTELAVELIKSLPCEIVSVDSAMVYRGMNIGTSKPQQAVIEAAPHRLIDILDPSEAYSAASFREDALREMADITAAGKIPLLVGGSMLYFHVLQKGLSELPAASPTLRARIECEVKNRGWGALHRRLQEVDPESARRIHPNDPQRLQRALEVYELTGIPLSEHHARGQHSSLPYRVIKFVLIPTRRDYLHQRIARRFYQMLEQGLIREVETLYLREDLNSRMPSVRAVGYRQVWKYLEQRIDYETMVNKAIIATRQFAKRQLTWLRPQRDAQRLFVDQFSIQHLTEKISTYVRASCC
jgi:tRNA dimethylallyltransferase